MGGCGAECCCVVCTALLSPTEEAASDATGTLLVLLLLLLLVWSLPPPPLPSALEAAVAGADVGFCGCCGATQTCADEAMERLRWRPKPVGRTERDARRGTAVSGPVSAAETEASQPTAGVTLTQAGATGVGAEAEAERGTRAGGAADGSIDGAGGGARGDVAEERADVREVVSEPCCCLLAPVLPVLLVLL